MFGIVIDSTSSTPVEELEAQGIKVVPLNVLFGDESFIDGVDMLPEAFYKKMADYMPKGLPKTNCPSPGAFETAYRELVANGVEGVVVITISSGLSGTNNSARVAADAVAADGIKVEVIDSLNVCQVMSTMAEVAVRMRDAGKSLEEAADHLRTMAQKTQGYYILDQMNNLVKGGMAGKSTALAASALKIKPVLAVEKAEGEVSTAAKAKGTKGLYKELTKLINAYVEENGETEIRFCHANGMSIINGYKEHFDKNGIAYVDEVKWIGSVIGTFTGELGTGISLCPKSLL